MDGAFWRLKEKEIVVIILESMNDVVVEISFGTGMRGYHKVCHG